MLILTGYHLGVGDNSSYYDNLHLPINVLEDGINKIINLFFTAGQPLDCTIPDLKSPGITSDLGDSLRDLVSKVADRCGKADVYYVGDLKPHTCSLKSIFFNLSNSSSEDIRELLEKACTMGESQVEMINMANVRHIKLTVSGVMHTTVHHTLRIIQDYIDACNLWVSNNKHVMIIDEEDYVPLH